MKMKNTASPFFEKQSHEKLSMRRSFSEPDLSPLPSVKRNRRKSENDINLPGSKRTYDQYLIDTRSNHVTWAWGQGQYHQTNNSGSKSIQMAFFPVNKTLTKRCNKPYSCTSSKMNSVKANPAHVALPEQKLPQFLERSLPTTAPKISTNRDSVSPSHPQEQRLARISTSIVWLFLLCHTWRMFPTFYEFWYSDNGLNVPEWPFSLVVIEYISHSLILLNSAVNFLIYVFM